MKNVIIIIFINLLIGCLGVAPEEHWDSDDTRIWINEASRLDLDPFWFKEDTTSLQFTLLSYKQEFEGNITKQIKNSTYFEETSKIDSISKNRVSNDTLKGIWGYRKNGYEFHQFQGNQYPMSIFIDTNTNTIRLQHEK